MMMRFFAVQLVAWLGATATARRLRRGSSSTLNTTAESSLLIGASNSYLSGGTIQDVSIRAVQFGGYGLPGDWDGLIMPDFEAALMQKPLDFTADFETLTAYMSDANGGTWFCSNLSFRNTTAYLIALNIVGDDGEITLPYWCRDEAAEVVGVPSDWGTEEIFIRGVVFPYPGGITANWEEIPRPDFQTVLKGRTIPADMDLFREETESLLSAAFGSPWTCAWDVDTPLSTTSYSIAVRWPGFHSLTQAWCYTAVIGWSPVLGQGSFVEVFNDMPDDVNTINTWAEPHNANGVTPNTVIDSNDEPPKNNQQRMTARGY